MGGGNCSLAKLVTRKIKGSCKRWLTANERTEGWKEHGKRETRGFQKKTGRKRPPYEGPGPKCLLKKKKRSKGGGTTRWGQGKTRVGWGRGLTAWGKVQGDGANTAVQAW